MITQGFTQGQPLRIVSNLDLLKSLQEAPHDIQLKVHSLHGGFVRRSVGILKMYASSFGHAAIFLNCPSGELATLCLLKWIIPFNRAFVIVADLILPKPSNIIERVKSYIWKILFHQVALFVLHQRDFTGYQEYFGIQEDRTTYVPFKVNAIEHLNKIKVEEGDYIFTGGVSSRDYETLAAAISELDYKVVVLTPSPAHARSLEKFRFGKNVHVAIDDGSSESWVNYIANSMFVVLPIDPEVLSPAGVSTYLVAMALRKCVVVTDGPATRGTLDKTNAVLVAPKDPVSLRKALQRVYCNPEFRAKISEGGYQYAMSCGGTARLHRDLLGCLRKYLKENH